MKRRASIPDEAKTRKASSGRPVVGIGIKGPPHRRVRVYTMQTHEVTEFENQAACKASPRQGRRRHRNARFFSERSAAGKGTGSNGDTSADRRRRAAPGHVARPGAPKNLGARLFPRYTWPFCFETRPATLRFLR